MEMEEKKVFRSQKKKLIKWLYSNDKYLLTHLNDIEKSFR